MWSHRDHKILIGKAKQEGITASLRVAVTHVLSRTKGASVAQSIKDAPRVSTKGGYSFGA